MAKSKVKFSHSFRSKNEGPSLSKTIKFSEFFKGSSQAPDSTPTSEPTSISDLITDPEPTPVIDPEPTSAPIPDLILEQESLYEDWLVSVVLNEILPLECVIEDTTLLTDILKVIVDKYCTIYDSLEHYSIEDYLELSEELNIEMKSLKLPATLSAAKGIKIKIPMKYSTTLYTCKEQEASIQDFIDIIKSNTPNATIVKSLSKYPVDLDLAQFTASGSKPGTYEVVYYKQMEQVIRFVLDTLSQKLDVSIIDTTLYRTEDIVGPLILASPVTSFFPTGKVLIGELTEEGIQEGKVLCLGKGILQYLPVAGLIPLSEFTESTPTVAPATPDTPTTKAEVNSF